jgi:L-asparaginase
VARPRVLLVTTGGTITMVRGADGTLVPCADAGELVSRVPELARVVDLDVLPLANIDSSNLEPSFWPEMSRALHERMADYDGFVVTHGTDTLAYTAAAMSFMLQELPKPVVLTGAQVPIDDLGSDGRANLVNAVRVAVADLAEVVVVFGEKVIRGARAKKTSAFDLGAFSSANVPPIGTIGLSLRLAPEARPRARRRPLLRAFLDPRVAMLPIYPGLRPEVVNHLAATHAGLVLEGYGAGHIPNGRLSLVPAIRDATGRGIAVVVCTQCLFGSTEMERYGVGRAALDAGAIPAMDMTPEASLVKLMWVLGQATDLATVDSLMQKTVAAEMHEVR